MNEKDYYDPRARRQFMSRRASFAVNAKIQKRRIRAAKPDRRGYWRCRLSLWWGHCVFLLRRTWRRVCNAAFRWAIVQRDLITVALAIGVIAAWVFVLCLTLIKCLR